jgi:hypothetical protein
MSKAARSIRYFAIYLFFIGIVLVMAPNVLLSVFGFPATKEVWIRVLGVVVFNIGIYYWFAAVSEATTLFKVSVYTRALVFIAFLAFVLVDYVKPALIIFGAADLAGGLWTAWAIKQDQKK